MTERLPEAASKWTRRASFDPFAPSAAAEKPTHEKENAAPASVGTAATTRGIVMTPTMVRRRRSSAGGGAAVKSVQVISKQSAARPTAAAAHMALLGKRPRGPSPTRTSPGANTFKAARFSTGDGDQHESDEHAATQRTLFSGADEDDEPGGPRKNVLVVNEFAHTAELVFGAVAAGQRKSLLLTLRNPSQVGSARVKYEGYAMASATREKKPPAPAADARFKCDMHLCSVPADGRVTLRITFEPQPQDANQELVAMLKFTVNDRFALQCEVSGRAAAAVRTASSLRARMAEAQMQGTTTVRDHHEDATLDTVELKTMTMMTTTTTTGVKRRESLAIVVSPPRHRANKKPRVDEASAALGHSSEDAASTVGGFHGSWWEKRKTLSDEEWMQRQEEGFTKWMNFVLVDSIGDGHDQSDASAAVIIEHPHRATPARGKRKRRQRIDFSSLRVLAMKRMESMWSRAAMELYRSDDVTEAAGNLKNEITEGKLVVRRDRPAYADVGLQEELIELLNNYHPVWLCLALETVLGHRTMAQEKCSLRSVMTYCATLAEKSDTKTKRKNNDAPKNAAPRMPRQLRRVIVQHLIHDEQVAKRHRLVKNLKTPVEGGTLRTAKANPKISGRDYFDALMDSFAFKFFMVVLLLDRAAADRNVKFARFPCLFRVQPIKAKKLVAAAEDDTKHIKNSQGIVAEFCRLFLSREGRIDRHMKQLGYTVGFQQVPLDEVELEITNLAVDLRDGVRLAKLLETLTATPGTASGSSVSRQSLSSFLRVPALSRLQKIHNVEICLHFLQEKCGRDFLESIRSSIGSVKSTSGRLSFSTLRDKEDAKMLESMAKAVVDGHRERTLALLWKLISVFQLRSLVNVDRLTKEISSIKQRMSFRSMEFYEASPVHTGLVMSGSQEDKQAGLDNEVRELLLEWCRVVCANYFVRVADFSDSFADGRALCYLLHYYHPMLLTKGEIALTTTDYANSSTRAIRSGAEITKALENERRHYTLVNDRVKQLGEVPVLLPEQYDSTNPPDEKVIVTFVCYLQSRLMDSSREIHAAARLKRWWRSPRIRFVMRRKKNRAAKMIQRMWYTSSVKRLAIRRCRRLLNAARMIAGYTSAWLDRSRFLKLRHAVVALQRAFRRTRSAKPVDTTKPFAAATIQRAWRCHVLREQVRVSMCKRALFQRIKKQVAASRIKVLLQINVEHKREQREALRRYQEMLDQQRFEVGIKALLKKVEARCARTVQCAARAFLHRRRQFRAATKIQAAWRCFISRKNYNTQHMCAVRVQRAVRWWIQRRREEAMARFQQMLAEQERERKAKRLRIKVEHRSAARMQHAWRSFTFKKRAASATKIQSAFRGKRCQKLLCRLRKERAEAAAVVIQKHVRRSMAHQQYQTIRAGVVSLQAAVRGAQSRGHVLHFGRFRLRAAAMRVKMATWRLGQWSTNVIQRRRVMRSAATTIQKTWKMRVAYARFKLQRRSATLIQALVRGVQSRQTFDMTVFRAKVARTRMLLAAWTIARWSKNQLTRYHAQRHHAAVALQARVRMIFARRRFLVCRQAAVKIQSRFRGMLSREQNLNFFVFKWRAALSKRRLAVWRIQEWVLSRVQQYRRACQAATRIQARFRGSLCRTFTFSFATFKATQARCHRKMAVWKLQNLVLRVALTRRTQKASAAAIQACVRGLFARQRFVAMRQAAIQVQRVVRGFQSRRFKHNHAVFRFRVHRVRVICAAWKIQLWTARRVKTIKARRHAIAKTNWTRLSFGLLRARLQAVDVIAKSWTSYSLRKAVHLRAEETFRRRVSAAGIQQWWCGLQQQWEAKRLLQKLRVEHAKKVHREQVERAAYCIQTAWRSKLRHASAKQSRQGLFHMRRYFAAVRVSHAVFKRVIQFNRGQRGYVCAVRRVQSWWRGMLVRLHEKRHAVIQQRKKLATMALVTPEHPSAVDSPHNQQSVVYGDPSKPLTLSARLEMALHMLLHGKRLQDMLFASHTIEMCTRYSRECAWKCVQLKISSTIFAAIRGLNRSRPHVELLHQLLLVLVNLTSFQRKESKNYTVTPMILETGESNGVDQDELRAVDALVDLIHVHRDMHVIFVLASRILKHYLLVLKPHTAMSKVVFNQWSEAHRRLRGLHELLSKKMQVAQWTSKLPASTPSNAAAATPNASNPSANVMAKINPKTAVSVVAQLLKVIE